MEEDEEVEESFPEQPMVFPGRIIPDRTKSEALTCAHGRVVWVDTVWTDRSRLDDRRVGCGVVSEVGVGMGGAEEWGVEAPHGRRWAGQAFHLGKNKKVFGAELYAIHQEMMRFGLREEWNRNYTIRADAQAALRRCKTDAVGPKQALD
jgi:hypothetical protein